MSKRQSRSAEFIGKFHKLDRNSTDEAEHAKRWKAHLERWVRHLTKAHAERTAALTDLAKGHGAQAMTQAARRALEGRAEWLKERELQLAGKIEAVLAKVASIGFDPTVREIKKVYAALRPEIFPPVRPTSKDGVDRGKQGARGPSASKARQKALRDRVRTWTSEK
jgi:uncharacterized protein (UPF0335 family)